MACIPKSMLVHIFVEHKSKTKQKKNQQQAIIIIGHLALALPTLGRSPYHRSI